jgi:hypothetical protein
LDASENGGLTVRTGKNAMFMLRNVHKAVNGIGVQFPIFRETQISFQFPGEITEIFQ